MHIDILYQWIVFWYMQWPGSAYNWTKGKEVLTKYTTTYIICGSYTCNAIISSHNSFFIKPFLISQNIVVMKSNDDFEYIKVGLGKPFCTNSNCYDQPTADNL